MDTDVVQHLCGIFDTNAFVVSRGNTGGTGRGLYPLGAIMNHSCIPNTQHWHDQDDLMTVRAVVDIPEGTEVTNTYAPTLWGTRARAAHLAGSKLFTCTCQRCNDPTELGSYISSVACRQCPEGLLVPPSRAGEGWKCHKCDAVMNAAAVDTMVRAAGMAVARIPPDDARVLGAIVDHLTRVLSHKHYVVIELKYALIHAIMKQPLEGKALTLSLSTYGIISVNLLSLYVR